MNEDGVRALRGFYEAEAKKVIERGDACQFEDNYWNAFHEWLAACGKVSVCDLILGENLRTGITVTERLPLARFLRCGNWMCPRRAVTGFDRCAVHTEPDQVPD